MSRRSARRCWATSAARWSPSTSPAGRARSSRSPRSKLPSSGLLALVLALAIGGCGGGERTAPRPPPSPAGAAPRIEPLRCPGDDQACAAASGEIAYVEAVDPDGDGDAHFILLSDEGITAPGISVIDVGRELRPEPLPGPGDLLSAIGPVYRGSYGQRQIEAIGVRVARR